MSESHRSTRRRGPRWRLAGAVLLVAAISAASSAGAVYLYHRHCALRVVTLDMKAFVAELREGIAQGTVDEPEIQARFARLEAFLDALPANTVTLNREVVLGHAPALDLPTAVAP